MVQGAQCHHTSPEKQDAFPGPVTQRYNPRSNGRRDVVGPEFENQGRDHEPRNPMASRGWKRPKKMYVMNRALSTLGVTRGDPRPGTDTQECEVINVCRSEPVSRGDGLQRGARAGAGAGVPSTHPPLPPAHLLCPLPVSPWAVSADLSQRSHVRFLSPAGLCWPE